MGLKLNQCELCSYHQSRNRVVIPFSSCKRPLILFLGGYPSELEEEKNRPFYNAGNQTAGYWHNEIVEQIGYEKNHLAMNMIQCVPRENGEVVEPDSSNINACYDWLEKLFQVYKFKLVILYGEIPIKKMLGVSDGIEKYVGRFYLIEELGIYAFATLHPSSLINSNVYTEKVVRHIKLIKRFLKE